MKIFLSLILLLTFSFNIFSQVNNGLIAKYSFNSGNANDEVGNNHGTVNGATLSTDRFGNADKCYEFDGISKYIELPDDTNLKPIFPFTLSLWATFNDFDQTLYTAVYVSDEAPSEYAGFWIIYAPDGILSAGYGDGVAIGPSHRRTRHSVTAVDTGQWYHIVAVFNGIDDIDLYLDCLNDNDTYSGTGSSMSYSNNLGSLGRIEPANGAEHNGKIDDIRLYNRSLSQIEIDSLCNEPDPDIGVGINSITHSSNVDIFPNPASDFLMINHPKSLVASSKIVITNLQGQVVLSQNTNLETLNIEHLNSGIYIISFYAKDSVYSRQKFVKE